MMRQFLVALIIVGGTLFSFVKTQCPDEDPNLIPWDPAINANEDFVINGQQLLFTGTELTLRTIVIRNGGKLVLRDDGTARRIQVRHILIESNGAFVVGSQECPYSSQLDILLRGRSDATDIPSVSTFGRKFIGVASTGRIVIYGKAKLSWTYLSTTINAGDVNSLVELEDIPFNWSPGDRVVVASSDYDMNHAEEFVIADCPECTERQVKLQGTAAYPHSGTVSTNGIDTRAEIGILTHDIKIHGEMEPACYGSNFCQFFDYDTFGGHIQVLSGFAQADFHGIELFNMGQQQLGKYPIHYHVVGAAYSSYTRGVSVHHCFSRCVTLHASQGITVRDVVGYDTLGHCYFLEDGNEQDNQLIHNLGLVTKPGTLLPSDRDKNMCETWLIGVYPGYVPDAQVECMGASTFWIAHPNNVIVNNSAAGSVSNGFHYVFYRVPTGLSAGTLPPYHGERSTVPLFISNRAHSNFDNGLLIDQGVKVTQASQNDPSEALSLVNSARYMPHVNVDPLQPRSAAVILDFTSYKNAYGASVRGGDVWIRDSKFTDNDVAVTMNSDDLLPYDAGSHQELTRSTVTAASDRDDPEWQARNYPSVGVQLRGGPVLVQDNSFHGYTSTGGRETYAFGFYPQNPGQFGSTNTIDHNTLSDTSSSVYFGRDDPSSIHGSYDSDGDQFQVVFDKSGVLTGLPNSYVVRLDNMLIRGDNCTTISSANAAACVGNDYGQIFVKANTKTASMTVEYSSDPSYPVVLQGANRDNSVEYPDSTQYQVTVITNRTYRVRFSGPMTPSLIELSAHNFPQFDRAVVGIGYSGTEPTFDVQYIEWKQMENEIVRQESLTAGNSIDDVNSDADGFTYFFDGGSLWVKLVNRYAKDGYNYCVAEGCQIIRVTTT